jgi:fluoride exporter
MITTLWVAVGGALGSIARYWVAIAVARLLGPQFPWGTILINIVGSFVIGFFAALTATGTGRLSVPSDLRIFVMVGVCGGFTTFSAFSLQTLDLMRDGRTVQALANVGLSVMLCLVAVAAGHYGATTLAAPAKPPIQAEDGQR